MHVTLSNYGKIIQTVHAIILAMDNSMKDEALGRVCVVIPTYNEVDNITTLLPMVLHTLLENGIDCVILVVDDNSPDGTGEVVEKLSKENPRIRLLRRAAKMGLGSAYKAGFDYALHTCKSDVILEMDADFSHNSAYIPIMVQKISEGSDLALGSRYIEGGRVENWSTSRKAISAGANHIVRLLTRLPVKDCTSGFRAYSRSILMRINPQTVRGNSFDFQVEMVWRCFREHAAIVEVPITFSNRTRAKSKLSVIDMITFLGAALRIALERAFR
ncbi:MAG: polyprenol monophosphomannose synthase [Candidatus Bathyarchaeia archaeon]